MGNAIDRRLRILQLLPHKKDGTITVQKIVEILNEDGINAEIRTVQRDMDELSYFPINCDETKKPYRWFWDSEELFSIPAMGQFTALTFQLAEEILKPLLPKQSYDHLKPNFSVAKHVLRGIDKRKSRSWLNKVRIVPRSLRIISAPIREGIYDTVTQALYDDLQIEISYMAPSNKTGKPKTHIINPCALLHRDSITEFIGNIDSTDRTIRMLLHRIHDAKCLNTKSKNISSFNIDDFITNQLAQPFSGEKIKLKAWIHKYGKAHVLETPLSHDQIIDNVDNDAVIITATVDETVELKWWILGLGERIKVLEPKSLRDDIANTVTKAAELYT